uniref:Protein kinase domain-containing protein n=1 Tax=Gasterosteus aculeatus aculeatus TaxID=481459 RepID=A0AAQ4RFC5_GASAC
MMTYFKKELFILCNKSVRYKVLEFIGEGCFGKVAKCVNMNTNETTAIKILKDDNDYDDEVEMLKKLRTLDPERNNLVRFMDSFIVDDKSCITFELLDRSLGHLIEQRKKRLTLNEIRPITRQLLVALDALKGIGLLYTDLKLDNVMLVNHQDEPFRVKLIDFGLAMPASEVWEGMIVQPCAYRAPEVSLGLPISEAIDMWSLGCLLARLNLEDTRAFLNLLQMLLNPDAEMRITPEEALEHSFVTMSHLADYTHRSSYTQAAFELMVVCPLKLLQPWTTATITHGKWFCHIEDLKQRSALAQRVMESSSAVGRFHFRLSEELFSPSRERVSL